MCLSVYQRQALDTYIYIGLDLCRCAMHALTATTGERESVVCLSTAEAISGPWRITSVITIVLRGRCLVHCAAEICFFFVFLERKNHLIYKLWRQCAFDLMRAKIQMLRIYQEIVKRRKLERIHIYTSTSYMHSGEPSAYRSRGRVG